jgi:hypothetical protein
VLSNPIGKVKITAIKGNFIKDSVEEVFYIYLFSILDKRTRSYTKLSEKKRRRSEEKEAIK